MEMIVYTRIYKGSLKKLSMTFMTKVNLLLFLNKQKIYVKNTQNPFNTILKTQMFKRKPSETNKSLGVIIIKLKVKMLPAKKKFSHKILFRVLKKVLIFVI